MTPSLTFAEILAVLSAASEGDTEARVVIPDASEIDDLVTRVANAVNLLLNENSQRVAQLEASYRATQTELERLIAERTNQLQQSEAKFSKAFRASPTAITIAALPEGRWIEINDALVNMIGYTSEEVLGRTSEELGLVDPISRAKIIQAVQSKGGVRNEEIQIRTKTGALVDVLVSVEQVELNGQPCALTIQYDITELKRAEREVRRLNTDLEQRQIALGEANQELESFSYSVAHDLRTPLRGIDGFSQVLIEDYADVLDSEGLHYLQRIRDSAQSMARLIDDLLMLARITRSELHHEPVDLSLIAKSILTQLQRDQPDRKVDLIVADNLLVEADARLMNIALENLLGNAWKFTSKHPAARIEVGVQRQGDRLLYFVRDDGAGFDMKYAHKLFGVFERLHSITEFDGTGIGLVIVQRIIRRHGGKIWAEGEVDHGATIFFTLNEPLA